MEKLIFPRYCKSCHKWYRKAFIEHSILPEHCPMCYCTLDSVFVYFLELLLVSINLKK